MPQPNVRKTQITVERLYHEGGARLDAPILRGVVCTVVENPFAGKFVREIVPFMDALGPLAVSMANDLIDALGVDRSRIESYGKGAIVGVNGEIEHAAIWHAPGGAGLRAALEAGDAPVPGNQKLGAAGATLDIPIGNVDAPYVRSHYDSLGISITDAPRPNEILFALAFATGGRVHARLGGTTAAEARKISGRP